CSAPAWRHTVRWLGTPARNRRHREPWTFRHPALVVLGGNDVALTDSHWPPAHNTGRSRGARLGRLAPRRRAGERSGAAAGAQLPDRMVRSLADEPEWIRLLPVSHRARGTCWRSLVDHGPRRCRSEAAAVR